MVAPALASSTVQPLYLQQPGEGDPMHTWALHVADCDQMTLLDYQNRLDNLHPGRIEAQIMRQDGRPVFIIRYDALPLTDNQAYDRLFNAIGPKYIVRADVTVEQRRLGNGRLVGTFARIEPIDFWRGEQLSGILDTGLVTAYDAESDAESGDVLNILALLRHSMTNQDQVDHVVGKLLTQLELFSTSDLTIQDDRYLKLIPELN